LPVVPSVPPWRLAGMRGSIGCYPLLSYRLGTHGGRPASAMHARRLTGLRFSLPLTVRIPPTRTISARQYGHTHKPVLVKADTATASSQHIPDGKRETGTGTGKRTGTGTERERLQGPKEWEPNTVTARERLSREEVCAPLPSLSPSPSPLSSPTR
jgi:hypothetical protein